MTEDTVERARKVAEGLSAEERAVLIAWSPAHEGDDPPNYPKGFAAELSVMEGLQQRGLFSIDHAMGDDTRYYTTDTGRQVAAMIAAADGREG